MDTKTIVIFTSKTGHARAVAEHMAAQLGADVTGPKDADISGYDNVILGSGVYAGNVSKKLRKFIDGNPGLNEKTVDMFLTCKFSGEKAEAQMSEISSSMPFLRNMTYFSGVNKDSPASAVGIEEFLSKVRG